MTRHHNILEEVLGLDRTDLEALSRWQLVALAIEALEAVDVDPQTDRMCLEAIRELRGSLEIILLHFD